MLNAKYSVIRGDNPSDAEIAAWSDVKNIFDEFNDADHYLFSVPIILISSPSQVCHGVTTQRMVIKV